MRDEGYTCGVPEDVAHGDDQMVKGLPGGGAGRLLLRSSPFPR
jgi:hypothetical protein